MAFNSELYFSYIENDLIRNAYNMTRGPSFGKSGTYDFFENSVKSFQKFLYVIYRVYDAEIAKAKQRIRSKEFGADALATATATFARWASVKTPPNPGDMTLSKSQENFEKLYYRPILFLPKLVKGKLNGFTATSADREALKQRFLYKIVNTKDGESKSAFGYAKTMTEALELSRIANRGLNRAAWGINVHQIGAKEVKEITEVLQQSPSIAEHAGEINSVFFNHQGIRKYIELHNRAIGIRIQYRRMIANNALRYAEKYLTKSIETETVQTFKDIFNTYQEALDVADKSGMLQSMTNVHKMLMGETVDSKTIFNRYMNASQSTSFIQNYNREFGGDVYNRFQINFLNSRLTFNLR